MCFNWDCAALSWAPIIKTFDPLEERALAIYARAQALGLPVLFHQGTSPVRTAPLRLAHPLIMDQIAIRYPELRIIMAHMGHPWQIDTITVIRKHPHVYADISGLFYRPFSFYECLLKCAEWDVLYKLLFCLRLSYLDASREYDCATQCQSDCRWHTSAARSRRPARGHNPS